MKRRRLPSERPFTVERRWSHDGVLEFIYRPLELDLEAEVSRLASIVEHGRELANLIDFAGRPLEDDENLREPDPVLEAAIAKQVEADEELHVDAALTASSPSLRLQRRRARRFIVRPQEKLVLTASGEPVEGGWAAYKKLARQRGWHRPMTFSIPENVVKAAMKA